MDSPPIPPELTVIVIDHDDAVRSDVVAVLADDGIAVIANTGLGSEAIRLVTELAAAVVIVDPDLQDMTGIELVRSLHRTTPLSRILLLSSTEMDEFAIQALREGASGFLNKRVSLEILPRIVRSVAAGEAVITRTLTMRLIERLRQTPQIGAGLRPVRSPLSSREWEVLDLVRAGSGTREIAAALDLSVETVRSHVKNILRKLGVHSRVEAGEVAGRMVATRSGGPPTTPQAPSSTRFVRR